VATPYQPHYQPQQYQQPQAPAVGAPELAIAALVLGWLTIVFGLLAGVPAIICGHMALRRASGVSAPNVVTRRARTGLALGYIVSFVWIALFILIIILGMRS
jgi:hypothetical protein